MKKLLALVLAVLVLGTCLPVYAQRNAFGDPIDGTQVFLGGESNEVVVDRANEREGYQAWTYDQGVQIRDDRTFVPIRLVSENFNLQVDWDQASKMVTVHGQLLDLRMYVGSKTYTVNGEKRSMDVAPYISQDRTYIPMRFVAEALGIDVVYDHDSRVALIGSFTFDGKLAEAFDYGINPDWEAYEGVRTPFPVGGSVVYSQGYEGRYIYRQEAGAYDQVAVYSREILEDPWPGDNSGGLICIVAFSPSADASFAPHTVVAGGPGNYLLAVEGNGDLVDPGFPEAQDRFEGMRSGFLEILRTYRPD